MRDKKEMYVSVETALDTIRSCVTPVGHEHVLLRESRGRILFEDVIADINVPPGNNSAMDGFALKADGTTGASPESPRYFTIAGEVQAGGFPHVGVVADDMAIRIMTGAPIPEGADAVIPVEDTSGDTGGERLSVYRELHKHDNIRFAGEDIRIGQVILRRGIRLSSADLGILAALNRTQVCVYRMPRVAILSTGDEITEVGEEIRPGHIRNSNAYTLQSEVEKYNGQPVYLGIARDSVDQTREKILIALDYDIVITTGGVSRGKYDFIKDVLRDLGVELLFDSVKMKPGKPMIFGRKGHTLVFGLPGNPVSTMVSFIEFVRPVLLAMSGAIRLSKPEIKAIIDSPIEKKPGRKEYIRGVFSMRDGVARVSSTGSQGSGILRSMSIANCLIVLPETSPGCNAGDTVTIQLIHHEEMD